MGFYRALFFAYLTVGLLVFAFLVPPFQKSDEPAHFHRAVSLTNLDFFCDKDANGQYYFPMKRKYAELPDVMRTFDVAFRYDSKFTLDWLRADFSDPRYDEAAAVYRFCSLPPAGYLPNALGILVGKPFENPLVSFYLGRVFGAVFFALAIVLALKTTPDRYRPIVYFYAALPVVLHQVSANSYDAVQLSLVPLLFAYLMSIVTDKGAARPARLLIFMALLLWLINVRLFSYVPLLLLFFVIHPSRIARSRADYLKVASGFLVVTAVLTGFFDLVYLPRAADSSPDPSAIDASSQVRFVLNNPWEFVEASYNTLRLWGEGLFREGIGVFGWIDYTLGYAPYYIAVFLGGVLVYSTVQRDEALLRPNQILFLLAAVLLTAASLFFSLYAVWTPVGKDTIDGLQGRYFLGLLPFAIVCLSQAAAAIGRERLFKALLTGVALLVLFNIVRAVTLRYY